jgi:hypothetical protein
MEFWRNRYTVPGWFFVGSLAFLGRFFPIPLVQNQALHKQFGLAIALVALFAGIPLGFLIYGVAELFYRRVFGGTGRYVTHQRLRSGLLDILTKSLKNRETVENGSMFLRVKGVLEDKVRFPDRAIYILFWQSHGAKDFRDGCHRRWESFHVSWGIICALVLSIIVSFIYALSVGICWRTYVERNSVVLAIILGMLALFYSNSRLLARQAASQENLWIELFLSRVADNPKYLLEGLHI